LNMQQVNNMSRHLIKIHFAGHAMPKLLSLLLTVSAPLVV
jgi:hypothetical protein